MSNVVICSIARTPIGKFGGTLGKFKGSELGSVAIRGALIEGVPIREAFLGNVVSAGMGQAPCRQAVLGAGLPTSTICTTINKVCASGMKSVVLGAQALLPGSAVLAGGFESMSQIPRYLSRENSMLGNLTLTDGVVYDGLWDPYNEM